MSINISQEHSAFTFRTSVTIDSTTQRHIPEELKPEFHCCDNLKSRYEIFFRGNKVVHSLQGST
jgi:hypothetical protein